MDYDGTIGQLELEVKPSGDLRALVVRKQGDGETFEQIADPGIDRIVEILTIIAVTNE